MSGEKDFDGEQFTDEQLVKASSETTGGHPSQRSLWAQAELTRRLMESIREMNRSTSRYSVAILALTIMMLVLGLLQLAAATLKLPDSEYLRLMIFVVFISLFVGAGYMVLREFLRAE